MLANTLCFADLLALRLIVHRKAGYDDTSRSMHSLLGYAKVQPYDRAFSPTLGSATSAGAHVS